MTHDQFSFWLKGVMEFREGKAFSQHEMLIVQKTLNQVIPEEQSESNLFSNEKEKDLQNLCEESKKLATAWLAVPQRPKNQNRLNVSKMPKTGKEKKDEQPI